MWNDRSDKGRQVNGLCVNPTVYQARNHLLTNPLRFGDADQIRAKCLVELAEGLDLSQLSAIPDDGSSNISDTWSDKSDNV